MGSGIELNDPAESLPVTPMPDWRCLSTRCQNAYRAAGAACGIATAVKVIGGILGGIIALGSLAIGQPMGKSGATVFAAGIVVGLTTFVLFWTVGVMVAAIGEQLKATLDTAVYSSTFLNNRQRAEIMSLD
jgi:hypothetical protein